MPYSTEWVDPEVFLEHKGTKVYCTYKSDDVAQGPRSSCYSLNDLCGEESCDCDDRTCKYVFDVRELPNWAEPPHPPFLVGENDAPENKKAWEKYHQDRVQEKQTQKVIREALDRGLLIPPPVIDTKEDGEKKDKPSFSLEIRKADCLVLRAPEWFTREDFQKWRRHKDVAKWDWVGEGQDVFLVYDGGDLSDDGFLPDDIARTIHAEAEKAGVEYGTVWIKAV
jgi:hypothetical protein